MIPRGSGPVVFDLEFTAWEGSIRSDWRRPGEFREVVQIGAVRLNPESLKPVAEFDMLVTPRLNPTLSDFFVQLTGIANEALAKCGVDFITAFRAFLGFAGASQVWAHGRDDAVLAANLRLYGWNRTLAVPPYSNTIEWFLQLGIDLRGKHACDVPEAAGLRFEGRQHNALDDAKGVAAAMAAMIVKGAESPFRK